MADTFPLSGNIDPKTFPFLLVDLYRRGATGSLKVEGPTHPKALYFRGGRVLFGSSNDPKDQLGAILIENGKITSEQLDDVNTKVGPGNPLAKVLAESGYVNQRELGEAARVKVERILSDVIAYETGSFEFEDGVLPKGAVDLKLSTEKLLLAAVARVADRGFVLRHLESLGVVLSAAPDWDSQVSEIRAEAGTLLERLDGQRSLKEAVSLTRFEEFEGAKLACGLLFLGLATREKAPAATAGAASGELDLGDAAGTAFAPDNEDEARTLAGPAADAESPFFTNESPFSEPLQPPELPSIPYSEPETPAFVTDESSTPPIEGLLAEPASPTVVMPSVDAPPAPEEPTGFAFTAPSEPTAFAMNAGPELGLEDTEAALPPSPPRVSMPPPPTTAELPALGALAGESPTAPTFRPSTTPPAVPAAVDRGPSLPIAAHEPDDAMTVPPSRPSKEDLAALDALLNPSGTNPAGSPASPAPSASLNPSASVRMRSTVPRPQAQRWEPQFRPSSSGARRVRSRPLLPLVAAALAILGVAAMGIYVVRSLAPPPKAIKRPNQIPPSRVPPALVPPVSAAPATLPATLAPAPSPLPTPTVMAATPPPVTVPPATAPPATAPPATASAGGDARTLLRGGSFNQAAQGFASQVKRAGNRFSVQVLVACSNETIQKALDSVPSEELFILPVNYRGKACYRLCWGLYESQDRATAALLSLPDYFRQGGASPKVSPAAALLP